MAFRGLTFLVRAGMLNTDMPPYEGSSPWTPSLQSISPCFLADPALSKLSAGRL